MANIQTFLQNILSSRYGKDVRQSIHDAIEEVDKVADTAQGSATEAASIATSSATEAEQYRNEAKQYRDEAFSGTPEGYDELVSDVADNTAKIDIIIEKADLGIKETASGEAIHLTDSAEGKAVEYALFGKARQDGEPTPENPVEIEVSGASGSVEVKSVGKNLITYPYYNGKSGNGITWTVSDDGTIVANGIASGVNTFTLNPRLSSLFNGSEMYLKKGTYAISDGLNNGSGTTYHFSITCYSNGNDETSSQMTLGNTYTNGVKTFEITEDNKLVWCYIMIRDGYVANNLTFKPMIRLATDADEYEPYKETLSTIPTPNGLAGIKVSSGGNYTDQNGQQWICDEVAKYADGSGAYIQRLKYTKVTSFISFHGTKNATTIRGKIAEDGKANSSSIKANIISNVVGSISATEQYNNEASAIAIETSGNVMLSIAKVGNQEDLNTFISENDVYVLYELAEPITTPLTAEELAEISTFYPITNISNDFDCGMRVKYNADSKNYIDKKIALLTTAIVNNI